VLIVDCPDLVRRHAVPLGPGAGRATAILAGMVIMLAPGPVPPAIAALLAAVAMVAFRVVSPPQAYRAVSWQIVVLIGGLIPLTAAIQDTGAADRIADLLIGAVGTNRPYLLMLALFLVTVTLGQVVGNTAVEAGVSVQPVAMLIAVAGSASFLTPIATASNLMVMTPGDPARVAILTAVRTHQRRSAAGSTTSRPISWTAATIGIAASAPITPNSAAPSSAATTAATSLTFTERRITFG
jgi:hypothetical protein